MAKQALTAHARARVKPNTLEARAPRTLAHPRAIRCGRLVSRTTRSTNPFRTESQTTEEELRKAREALDVGAKSKAMMQVGSPVPCHAARYPTPHVIPRRIVLVAVAAEVVRRPAGRVARRASAGAVPTGARTVAHRGERSHMHPRARSPPTDSHTHSLTILGSYTHPRARTHARKHALARSLKHSRALACTRLASSCARHTAEAAALYWRIHSGARG